MSSVKSLVQCLRVVARVLQDYCMVSGQRGFQSCLTSEKAPGRMFSTKSRASLSRLKFKHYDMLFSNTDKYDSSRHPRHLSIQTERDKYSIKNELFRNYLIHLKSDYEQQSYKLARNEITVNKEFPHLGQVVNRISLLLNKSSELEDIQNLFNGLSSTDDEMKQLANEESSRCKSEIEELESQVIDMLIPDKSGDHNDAILEVTAGVGGQEAMLFTDDIFKMYNNFAQLKHWDFQIINYETSEIGGLRRASASISGIDVYKALKFEAGVHRVQRVPKTEKSGRVHTSTMTVAVLPQPTEIDITLNPKDLIIETCRSSGKGGQHVNTTDSAVRIVHTPTGTVAECQTQRSQIRNKETAMTVLKSRLFQKLLEEQTSEQQQTRNFQVGTAGRSEKIRTYNFSQDRVTDHRLNRNLYSIERFMAGKEDFDNFIQDLSRMARLEYLDVILYNYSQQQKS